MATRTEELPISRDDFDEKPLHVVIATLQALLDKVPAQYRENVRFTLDSEDWVRVGASYEREETPEEVAATAEYYRREKDYAAARDRENLNRLAEKYGLAVVPKG